MMKQVPIHWEELEGAFERNAPDVESFLDIETGHVVTIGAGDSEAPPLRQKIAENLDAYVRVEPVSSREQYRWMERFVSSIADAALRERLLMAIDGKGAFRRFKDVLLAYPTEREHWFSYRTELVHWHMQEWLKEQDIETTTTPPWGTMAAPPDLPEVAPHASVHGPDAPGETLRRQARELIDSLAAIELPSAVAFLEFLRGRGPQGLAGGRSRHTSGIKSVHHISHVSDDDTEWTPPGPVDTNLYDKVSG